MRIKQSILTITALLLFVGAINAATIVVPPGGDLQAAISTAQLGDTIIVQAGAFYNGPFTLPLKTGVGYVTIQSSRANELPVGVRVSPLQDALFAKLQKNVAGEPVIKTAAGAHHFKFVGVEISTVSANITVFDLVRFGDGRGSQKTLESVPHDLIIDRSWIRGFSTQDVQRGVAMNCANCELTNSYVSDIHGVGFDTQAVCAWNTPGPLKVVNSYLEGAGENVLLGGADPASEAFIPSNVDILRNTISKPLTWKVGHASFVPITRNGSTVGPNGVPLHWTVKNNVEVKNGKNINIAGNIIENNWTDGQTGIPILFTTRNQDGTAPYSVIQNVNFSYNTVKNTQGAINLLGADNEKPSQRASGLTIRHNVFDKITGHFLTINGYNNVTIERNTHIQTCSEGCNTMELYGTPSNGFIYRDNVNSERAYGIHGPAGSGKSALDLMAPGSVFTGNVIGTPYANIKFAGNEYPVTLVIGADYRTPYVGKGADIDELNAAQVGGVSSPTPSPTPTPIPSPSPSPTPTATPTPVPSPTVTPVPSPLPSPSASPSPSPTPKPKEVFIRMWPSSKTEREKAWRELAGQGYLCVPYDGVLYCWR